MRFLRHSKLLAGTLLGAGVALTSMPALAQSVPATNDETNLVPVVIWTCVAAVLAMLVVSVGYLYRRERGLDHPLSEPPVPPAEAADEHDAAHAAGGH